MKNENMYDVVIAGAGPAGLTAAIYLARACYRVLVVEKEKKCSPLLWILAIVGFVAAVAGIAYAVYRYFTPDYLEDFEDEDYDDDDFEDEDEDFEDDFFEEEDEKSEDK